MAWTGPGTLAASSSARACSTPFMWVGPPSVVQRRLIEGTGKCAILLPDTDTHADLDTIARARQLALDWSSADLFAHGAHVVVLPAKDAGEMDRQSIWTAILSQVDGPTREYLLSEVLPRM